MKIELTHQIDWPNGQGHTPCSAQYMAAMEERDAIGETSPTLDGLSPENYQRWNELDSEMLQMQVNGHVGKSVRY